MSPRGLLRAGLAAIAFLTRVPVGHLATFDAADVARAASSEIGGGETGNASSIRSAAPIRVLNFGPNRTRLNPGSSINAQTLLMAK